MDKRYDKYNEVFYIEYQNDNSYLIKSIFNTFLGVSNRMLKKSFNLSFYRNVEVDNKNGIFYQIIIIIILFQRIVQSVV